MVNMGQPGEHFEFLGYRFWRSRKSGKMDRYIRPKSEKKFKEGIKPLTKRANRYSLREITERLKPKLEGFYGYFKNASAKALRQVDGWVRGRLRSILRKRAGLKGRGRGQDHKKWSNDYFTEHGYFSLEAARREEITSLPRAATH